jgi:hypothetical protein
LAKKLRQAQARNGKKRRAIGIKSDYAFSEVARLDLKPPTSRLALRQRRRVTPFHLQPFCFEAQRFFEVASIVPFTTSGDFLIRDGRGTHRCPVGKERCAA